MKKSRDCIALFTIAILIFSGSCKKPIPTGPDPGNGQTQTIQVKAIILMNGQPLADVDVYLSGHHSRKTSSGADGFFGFSDLPSGTYYITPSMKGLSFNPVYYKFSHSVVDLTIEAQPAVLGADLGSIMADFTAKNQNNTDVSLYNFFGRLILVNFSADWCGPCKTEAGHLNALNDKYKDRGFQVITLLISGSTAEWAETYGLNIPVLDDLRRAVFNVYTNGFVPLNILLGRNCNILYEKDGYNEVELEEWITKFL